MPWQSFVRSTSFMYMILTSPWMWLVGPEVLMMTELTHGWLAWLTSLLLIDDKSLETKSETNWQYLDWLWKRIEKHSNKIIDKAQQTTERWGDTRRRAKSKTNKQVAHRSNGVESTVRARRRMVVLTGIIAFAAFNGYGSGSRFDSDSVLIHVDNCASRCVTNDISDFVRAPTVVKGRVKGIGGSKVLVKAIGTIKWTFDDDEGRSHAFLIPGALYVPTSPARLFSPQHWAQSQKDHKPKKDGTWQATLSDHVILNWGQREYIKRIEYNSANVATFWTTPGSKQYRTYKAEFDGHMRETQQEPVSFNSTVVTDDEAEEWERSNKERGPPDFDNNDDEEDQGDDDDDDPESENDGKNDQRPPRSSREQASGIVQAYRPAEAPTEEMHQANREDQGGATTTFDLYRGCEIIGDEEEVENELGKEKMTPRAELMGWHYRLGHLPFKRLRAMAERGIIPKRLADCRVPKCSACIYGKMTRRAKRTKSPSNQIGSMTLTSPGQCVSVDQLESNTPGFIAQLKGIPTTARYRGATIYVDHFSRASFVYLQRRLTSEETVRGKKAFERYCDSRGVQVKHYHADNGRFADNMFIKHAATKNQSITYCGVNAHWQNGICEKRIRDLQELTTTMLLHAEAKWPKVITANLWPYALRCANDAMNETPRMKDREIPIQLLTGSSAPTVMRHFHPFGCPTYVLNSKLQAGQSIPKWYKRARLGVYLGRSPRHAQSVALVMNLKTGLVSPAFHVAFDDHFETLQDHDDYPNQWKAAAHFGKFRVTKKRKKKARNDDSAEVWHLFNKRTRNIRQVESRHDVQETEDGMPEHDDGEPEVDEYQEQPDDGTGDENHQEQVAGTGQRWSRRHKPTRRLQESGIFGNAYPAVKESPLEVETVDDEEYHGEVEYEIQKKMEDPIAFAASSDPDIMYLNQALKQPDKKQFIKAMKSEIESHTTNKHWVIVPRSAVPEGMPVLPTVWAMRRKRRIVSREIYKWKARLNVHGGKQTKGVNYWETYAAVVRWSSIRFFLIMSLIKLWHSRQIDFVLAYPQAEVECDMYVEIPSGFEFKGSRKTHCLKLLRNIYGQKQAGRVWQKHLFDGLKAMGFEQSQSDECVFFKGKTVFMVYTDDGIFCGPDQKEIDSIIKEMRKQFNITDEGKIDEYLGVKVSHLPDGSISLTQPHLIDSIISDMGFKKNTKSKPTPAPSTIMLQRDEHGDAHDEVWEYRSIIGKMNFLEKSTRPELAYSVHQAARFSSDPKASHSAAVRHIVRYLMDTRDKGLILSPNGHSFTCYADADFAGNWHKGTAHYNSMTAKSRGSYIVMYAGCPVVWSSKLITEIALSSTESEYAILSEAAREVIGMMGLMTEVKERMCEDIVDIPTIRCTIFEDNEGAIALAKLPKMRPRTKHINVKMHWFRKHVGKTLLIESIDTLDQLADIGTKPLAEELFKKLRFRIMGW